MHRPLGMVGRIAFVLICAVALELVGNIALHQWQQRELVSAEQTVRIARTIIKAEQLALANPPESRGRTVHGLAKDGLALNWVPRTVITDVSGSMQQLKTMRSELITAAPELAKQELRLSLLPSRQDGQHDLIGAFQIADGSFLTFRYTPFLEAPPRLGVTVALHLLLLAVVMGSALLMVRTLIRPLRNLADAADATGKGRVGVIVAEGPHEVRRVATAFSAMQARLLKAMEDQTIALVAVSHDLRTPIQRLRLRAALLDDAEARDAMTGDLLEMEHFIGATLAYFRSGEDEQPRLLDVATIVSTAVDVADDLGDDIAYHGPDELLITSRPLVIKRILANLIDNARRHAEKIEVTLEEVKPDHFSICVEDDGPGIAPERRAEALLPFRRLHDEKDRGTGGAGLGLATVSKAVDVLGGSLILGESHLGGLSITITLPKTEKRAD